MDRTYGGVIWTDHALARMRERGISQGDAWATFRNPDQSRPAQKGGNWVYYKTYGSQKIEVVASKNEKGQWMILSVWSSSVNNTGRPAAVNKIWDSLLEKVLRKIFGRVKKN